MNLSPTATLGTEESGHCRDVETRVNLWTVRQKNGHCREMAVSGASAVYYYYQHSYMDSICIFSVFRSSLLLSLLSLYLNLESNTYWQSTCASSFVGE